MSSSYFDTIPLEILQIILDNLSYNDLKSCCLISKRWNEVISSYKRFLNKTHLAVKIRKKDSNYKLTRKYRCMSIAPVDSCVIRGDVLRQLAAVGDHLMSMRFFSKGFVARKDFIEFMRACPSIETLEVWDLMIRLNPKYNNYSPIDSFAQLPQLKKVEILCSDWVMKHLECRELTFLHVSRVAYRYVNCDSQNHIIEFINKLTSLDRLMLEGINLTSDVALFPQFKWTHLKIGDITEQLDTTAIANWRRFLAASVDKSKVSIEYDQVDKLVSLILNECEKIDQFKFHICSLPPVESPNEEYFPDLMPVEEVKSIKVRAADMDRSDARAIFFTAKFRNIEYLDIDHLSVLWFHPISIPLVFHNVKHLKIELYVQAMQNFEFPNLETITFGTFGYLDSNPDDSMDIFATYNPNVKYINVNDIDDEPDSSLLVGYKLSIVFLNADFFNVINPQTQQMVKMTRQEIEKKITEVPNFASHLGNINNHNNNIIENNNDNDNQN